jgi:GAF domain-containing protein
MSEPENPYIARWQAVATQLATEVTALLKQDFSSVRAYLDGHSKVLQRLLSPKHLSYGLVQSGGYHPIVNAIDGDFQSIPHQKEAFQKCIQQVLKAGAPIFLQPKQQPAESLRILTAGDVPSPEDIPPFNATDAFQAFVPLPLGGRVIGCMHIALAGIDPAEMQIAAEVCVRAAALVELYLKTRQAQDFTQEISRLQAYSDCLERLCGDLPLEKMAQFVVDYAREATGADRVSLLLAGNLVEQLGNRDTAHWQLKYQYAAGSGTQLVEPKSTEAQLLGEVVDYFLKKSVEKPDEQLKVTSGASEAGVALSTPLTPFILTAPVGRRDPVRLLWIKRDTDASEADQVVEHYLNLAPMNWVTYIPLVDASHRIVGVLLFEGKGPSEPIAEAILKSQALVYSCGKALASSIFWSDRATLRWARKWIEWKDGALDSPVKRRWAYWGLPFLLLLGMLLWPTTYWAKAEAQVRPSEVYLLAAQTNGRILEILAHEGSLVQKGQLLMVLDTQDLEYQRQKLESEFLQALAEADAAQGVKDEATLQLARFKAQKVEAQLKSLSYQIDSAQVKAIFDGFILGPQNLQQKLGHMAKIGDPLVELAAPDRWEVKLQFQEQAILTLQQALTEKGSIPAALKLTSDPDFKYELTLKDPSALMYGLEPAQENYFFIGVMPLPTVPGHTLKAGFKGKMAFDLGIRPLGYILFKDIIRYIRVYWF